MAGEGLAGVVAQECAFDEGADAGAFFGVELVERGEVQAQRLVLGAAFVGVEDEVVGGDGQSNGEGAQDVEGGLVGAGFVAAQLGDVDADGVGEGLLGHAALFADLLAEDPTVQIACSEATHPLGAREASATMSR